MLPQKIDWQNRNIERTSPFFTCYALLGRDAEAKAESAEVLRIDPNISLVKLGKQLPYKDPAELQLVLGSLRKAGLK